MTLGQLRTFLTVARLGSIGKAAAALVVTEPSVSAAVAALKKELGVDLIERDGRGTKVTAAGAELARYAEQILGLCDRGVRAAREAAGAPGHLRLVGVTTAGEYVLPPILAEFRARHPEVQVSLEVGNRTTVLDRLLGHEADLAVGGRPLAGSRVGGEAFLTNELVVVSRPGHPLQGRRSIAAQRVEGEPWLLREPGSGTRTTTEEFWALQGISPSSVMTVGSNGAIKQAAAVGLGVTLMSRAAIATELELRSLTELAVKGTPLRRSWHVLYLKGATLPRSAQLFLKLLSASGALLEDALCRRTGGTA